MKCWRKLFEAEIVGTYDAENVMRDINECTEWHYVFRSSFSPFCLPAPFSLPCLLFCSQSRHIKSFVSKKKLTNSAIKVWTCACPCVLSPRRMNTDVLVQRNCWHECCNQWTPKDCDEDWLTIDFLLVFVVVVECVSVVRAEPMLIPMHNEYELRTCTWRKLIKRRQLPGSYVNTVYERHIHFTSIAIATEPKTNCETERQTHIHMKNYEAKCIKINKA